MRSARQVAQELPITELISERASQACEVRNRRSYANQNVAFGTRPFILCGLPIRPLPADVLTYRCQNGKFRLEITGPQAGAFFSARIVWSFSTWRPKPSDFRQGAFISAAARSYWLNGVCQPMARTTSVCSMPFVACSAAPFSSVRVTGESSRKSGTARACTSSTP
jgi:hypothetical protein